ncbi:histidine triad nucleotide-binding protein [Chitinibacter bivalviorum]|uniref:Histidine triad nucleotide-binding protein n=1 Tax=Chitinibacter bivalviorum TaxID=2739434 RepID=A0A7H9BJI2_9NEIS|nr:histidine triad nucleotide-binding protein [Chitinibacter bivalviorum]QLG88835.1 histidine triad nucleotide-binding protein [Chitinibacter bivalviorum]
MTDCIFCKIASGAIPADKVYEDDDVLAFRDIRPAAPVHLLLIPKKHIDSMLTTTKEDEALLGKMLALTPNLARDNGLGAGYKTAINTGLAGGQEVFHLHLHILGTPQQ